MELYLLFESAAGYVLLHATEWEQIGQDDNAVQLALNEVESFGRFVEFKAFHPFQNAEEALSNMKAIANSEATDILKAFLERSLPKKKKKYHLGLCDPSLAKALSESGFSVAYDKNVIELLRACRLHLRRFVKQLKDSEYHKFQIGLGHSYSRSNIQFDPNRQDKPITQSIALIDSLDKNINLFAMRVKEWYCWHFPELGKIVTDNVKFVEAVKLIRVRDEFDNERLDELTTLVQSEDIANEILQAMKTSMGQDITEADMENIEIFADQVIKLSLERAHLSHYLQDKLTKVAPNLQVLLGDTLAARLISHAGSLTTLAKYPASTIQILGAEKALFRALKSKGNTPKYGLLFQSSFIGRAAQKNKGRISRYLANKSSLCARIDFFNNVQSNVFGTKMKEQVEERMTYLTEKTAPRKNLDVMREAVAEYNEACHVKKKKRKRATSLPEVDEGSADVGETRKSRHKRTSV